jgi:hypothetical protein
VYFTAATLPDGYSVTFFGGNGHPVYLDDSMNNLPWYVIVDAPLWMKISIPVKAAYGPQTLSVSLAGSSYGLRQAGTPLATAQVIQIPVTVRFAGNPKQTVPIPNLWAWEEKVSSLADKWMPQVIAESIGQDCWYYDISRCTWQMCDYFKSQTWRPMALAAAQQYRDFVVSNNGQLQGYQVFPKGLRMTWERTGDDSYKQAALMLSNDPWTQQGGSPDPTNIRETSYAVETWLEAERLGQASDPRLLQAVNFLLGHFDLLFRQECGKSTGQPANQPFFAGLAAEALIAYYETTQDARIIEALRLMTRYIWEHGVDQNTGSVLYDLWLPNGDRFCSLNLLMVLAWGFLWKETGDIQYRQQGDFLFSHFADLEGIDFSAKVFAQNTRSAFDYIKYRGF